MDAIQCCPHTFRQLYELTGQNSCKQSKFQINRMKFITFQKNSYKLDEIHYIFHTNSTKTYYKHNLNDRRRPTTKSGHEPEKVGHCLCLLLIRLDNLLLQSGGDLPCTTLPRCRLRPRTRAGFVVVEGVLD